MMNTRSFQCLAASVLVMTLPAVALAHAFVDHASPAVGSQVDAPAEVKIWFTEAIEPAFSGIEVDGPDGKQVDQKDAHVDKKDHALMVVSVPKLPPGTYTVVWHVVSADTHKTHGDFKFTVKP